MKLNNNKVLYISLHDPQKDPGVENKIQGFCNVAKSKGYEVERITRYCKTIGERREVIKNALASDARIIFIRSFGTLTIAIVDQLIKAKKQGRILICDQPTPLTTSLQEIWQSKKPLIKRIYGIGWGIISGPWGMWPYDRIIEYADESSFFSWRNKKSILLIGNGIDVSRIQLRNQSKQSNGVISLVGVANTSIHHGFDRVIKAIAEYNSVQSLKAYFRIIGGAENSPVIRQLKDLASKLEITKYIEFEGFRDKQYIANAYCESDLAVGSLGLHRIGLISSSILKVREYCLAGIPFIASGYDPDFPETVPFRFEVPSDESVSPIVEVLKNFPVAKELFTNSQIREYGLDHFSYDKKFDQIMNGLI